MTFRLPFPRCPCIHMTYCRYAECLIARLSYIGVNTYVSARLLIAVARLSESKQIFWNARDILRHRRFSLQHNLSLSVGISRQYPHTQNGIGALYGGRGCPGSCGTSGSCWTSGFTLSLSTKSLNTSDLDVNPSFATFMRVWWKLEKLSWKTVTP
jgi:hypothetical protein